MPLDARPTQIGASPTGPRIARFQSYVKTSKINTGGEVEITLAVPLEDKYRALPVTDIRGLIMVVDVHAPPGMDEGDLALLIEVMLGADVEGDGKVDDPFVFTTLGEG